MGQSEIINFLEKGSYRKPEGFTKKEMEEGIGRKVKDHSLIAMVKYGEISRECENLGNGHGHKQFRYKYRPNGSFSIANPRRNKTSAIPKFYELSTNDKVKIIGDFCGLSNKERRMLWSLDAEDLKPVGENVVGTFPYFLGFANYFKINGKDYFIPVVTEEASVNAADCYGAKLCYDSGGIQSSVVDSNEFSKAIGQVQFIDVKKPEKAKKKILENKEHLLLIAGEGHQYSKPYDVDVEKFVCDLGNTLIVNLHINPGDAMGAAVASQMADSIAPEISKMIGADYNRGIISNYSGRLTEAELKVPIENLARKSKKTGKEWSGEEVKDKILWLDRLARKSIRRAVTNDKGVMNDVVGVSRATANDDRAIYAANAAYAVRDGRYKPLSRWHADDDYLHGELKMLIPCGTVGGEIKNYPKAEFMLKRVLHVEKADDLAEIMASVGLAGNLAALSMNTTIGTTEGHEMHRK